MPFVRRPIREWANDLEIWDSDGKKRKMSKSTVDVVFKKLIQDGLVTYLNDDTRVRAYAVLERNLSNRISARTGLRFQELKELPEDYLGDESWTESGQDLDKRWTEPGQEVDIKPQGNQGFQGSFGTGTYTDTGTYTYNKSHKSEERNFIKNEPQRIGAILHGSADPDAVHNSTTVQDMFKIWQEEFPDSDERLNTRSASWLKAAYDSSFNEDLRAWRNYLRKAKTSEFIMDRPHLLCLKWLLSFETIGNIGRGAYDVSEPEVAESVDIAGLMQDCDKKISVGLGARVAV
jgi:hypothetical protein